MRGREEAHGGEGKGFYIRDIIPQNSAIRFFVHEGVKRVTDADIQPAPWVLFSFVGVCTIYCFNFC